MFFVAHSTEENEKKRKELRKDFEAYLTAKALPWLTSELPLFNYPDPATAKGQYLVGFVPNPNEAYPFSVREDEMLRHTMIVGSTGSGKTNLVFLLIKYFLQYNKPFLVFDWKRNYPQKIDSRTQTSTESAQSWRRIKD